MRDRGFPRARLIAEPARQGSPVSSTRSPGAYHKMYVIDGEVDYEPDPRHQLGRQGPRALGVNPNELVYDAPDRRRGPCLPVLPDAQLCRGVASRNVRGHAGQSQQHCPPSPTAEPTWGAICGRELAHLHAHSLVPPTALAVLASASPRRSAPRPRDTAEAVGLYDRGVICARLTWQT